MGLFDTIHCEYPLPDARHQDLEFQTKDLERLLANYTITRDGRLVRHARNRQARAGPRHRMAASRGHLRFYTSFKISRESVWVEYVARFTHGRVEWIRPRRRYLLIPKFPRQTWTGTSYRATSKRTGAK